MAATARFARVIASEVTLSLPEAELVGPHPRVRPFFYESGLSEKKMALDHVHLRKLLMILACTRARDRLHISGTKPVSEFLGDIRVSRA
jgi:hypothetical protein